MATTATPGGMLGLPNTDQIIEANSPDNLRKLSADDKHHPGIMQRTWGYEARVDHSVTFEEYRYWAKIERELEDEDNRVFIEERGPLTVGKVLKGRFSKGVHHENAKKAAKSQAEQNALQEPIEDEKADIHARNGSIAPTSLAVTDEEWRTAARALRTASWGTIFFVMTTDILGFSGAPFVFSSVGYGPGVALYVIFGIAAGFSGWAIWRCFMGLDSSRYPMLSYGDPFFRIFGPKSRHFINIIQSVQQFLTVAVLILGSGQLLAQIAQNKICFVVCMVICMVIGMAFGMIRSLQRLGWLCNLSVWLNVATFIMCAAAANNAPDYSVVLRQTLIKKVEEIKTFAGPPPSQYQQQSANQFSAQFNAVDSMVYSYAGALLFVAFLSEMRHPWDFWKGMLVAQTFICFLYIFFGAFVYSFFGQYSLSVISQVIQPYALQTVSNVLGLLTGLIAVFLYFNIGMKTVYLEVFQEILHCPPITTKKGKFLWYAIGPVYWIIAFIVAAAVPNINGIVGIVGGLLSINFTYSFPAIMYTGYVIQNAAALPGESFDPETRITVRHDSGMKRWVRGFKKSWYIALPTMLYAGCGLACSGMGTWAAIEGLIQVFGPGGTVATKFGCAAPV